MPPKKARIITSCKNCNTEFADLAIRNRKFCSLRCSTEYNNSLVSNSKHFKFNHLKTEDGKRCCRHCGVEIKNKKSRQCNTCVGRIRRYELKKKAVEYKGGKCEKCGYNHHLAALEFHHADPSQKDFAISKKHNYKWESLVNELDKCVLICSNCHRIEHSKYYQFAE